jgi:transposase InsO family protein
MLEGAKISYQILHDQLGHVGEDRLQTTAKSMGWIVTGKVNKCEDCAKSKARQANLPQSDGPESKIPGERLCLDISSVKTKSKGGKKFWLLVMDEATKYCWSYFLPKKSDLGKTMLNLVKKLQTNGTKIRYICCDNAGENLKFQELLETEGHKFQFEFMAPGTPQQNGMVERMFATLMGRVRSMMNRARFTRAVRDAMWAECAATATKLENHMLKYGQEISPIAKMEGKTKDWFCDLWSFGEIAIVLDNAHKKMRGKLEDRGYPCMFLGYSDNHASNVYQFLNLKTQKVLHSRDITWLNKFWGEYVGIKKVNIAYAEIDGNEDNLEHDIPVVAQQVVAQPRLMVDTVHKDNQDFGIDVEGDDDDAMIPTAPVSTRMTEREGRGHAEN